jgi:integral membrane protein
MATPVSAHDLIRRFRVIALLEGASFLILLGIAMPLKYFAGMPLAVRVVGMAHGMLFVAYLALVAALLYRRQWSLGRAGEAMMMSVLPFGTFVFDRSLKEELAGE